MKLFSTASLDKKLIIVLIILAFLNLFHIFTISESRVAGSDSYTYTAAMEHLLDRPLNSVAQVKPVDLNEFQIKTRLLTAPLMVITSMAVGMLANDFIFGMILINTLFYLLLIFVFYFFSKDVYKSSVVAFFSTFLVLFAYVMHDSGVSAIADIGGWFFMVLTSFCALKYYQGNDKKFFYLAIVSSVVGVFFKETGALGMISLGMFILFSAKPFINKIKEIALAAILFLIVPLLYYLYFYWQFNFTYLDWYGRNADAYFKGTGEGNDYNLILLIKVLGWLYLAGWPLFLYGAWLEWKEKNKARLLVLLALLPASLMFLLWPALVQRIAFIFVFWLALISGYALSKMNKYLVLFYLVFYIIIAYTTPVLRDIINLF